MANNLNNSKAEIQLIKYEEEIVSLYKAGLTPKQIAQKYPAFGEQEVLLVIQSRFSLSNYGNWDTFDAMLLSGYIEDMEAVANKVIKDTKDPEIVLKAYLFRLNARNYAVKFRSLISELHRPGLPNGGPGGIAGDPSSLSESSGNFGSVEIEETIKRKIRILPPHKQGFAYQLVESFEREQAGKLLELLDQIEISDNPEKVIEGEFSTDERLSE